jgi:hypothetical protein
MQVRKSSIIWRWLLLCLSLCLLTACSSVAEQAAEEASTGTCQVIYDAGSSSTRLYLYEQTANGWIQHRGRSSAALSDPVRRIRGKSENDIETVVGELIDSLREIQLSGDVDCDISGVAVLATGGMRIAERQDPATSALLWSRVESVLGSFLGIPVDARTISGFEEGLYAWMAQREEQGTNDFGLVEMGGASFQVVFPCDRCSSSRRVRVVGQPVRIYSRSLNDWGQDEAWHRYGNAPACQRGAGKGKPGWQVSECTAPMVALESLAGGIRREIDTSGVSSWYTAGAYRYSRDDDVERFCRQGELSDYQPESACFRAAYLHDLLEQLGIAGSVSSTGADWTLGAAICAATRCLETN